MLHRTLVGILVRIALWSCWVSIKYTARGAKRIQYHGTIEPAPYRSATLAKIERMCYIAVAHDQSLPALVRVRMLRRFAGGAHEEKEL